FTTAQTINEIDVFTVQDNITNPVTPSLTMLFSQYGITDYQVQYWTGSVWADVPGGNVQGNRNVWRRFVFAAISTSKIRVYVNGGLRGYSRIVEVQAYHAGSSASAPSAGSGSGSGSGATPTPAPTAAPTP